MLLILMRGVTSPCAYKLASYLPLHDLVSALAVNPKWQREKSYIYSMLLISLVPRPPKKKREAWYTLHGCLCACIK